MKIKLSIFLGFCFVIVVILFTNTLQKAGDTQYIGQSYYLSDFDRKILSVKALYGDKNAAFKLSEHYLTAQNEPIEGHFWLKTAAENGHAIAQYNLATTYLEQFHDKPHAIFWYKKSAALGDKDARERLQVLLNKS